eukprot:709997-Prymnesium_polylepis.1
MRGADGKATPFISGHVEVLSRRLACTICQEDFAHSLLKAPYGTSSDDANLGRWVAHAERSHALNVRVSTADLLYTLQGEGTESSEAPKAQQSLEQPSTGLRSVEGVGPEMG